MFILYFLHAVAMTNNEGTGIKGMHLGRVLWTRGLIMYRVSMQTDRGRAWRLANSLETVSAVQHGDELEGQSSCYAYNVFEHKNM